jgi:hypothetical protein
MGSTANTRGKNQSLIKRVYFAWSSTAPTVTSGFGNVPLQTVRILRRAPCVLPCVLPRWATCIGNVRLVGPRAAVVAAVMTFPKRFQLAAAQLNEVDDDADLTTLDVDSISETQGVFLGGRLWGNSNSACTTKFFRWTETTSAKCSTSHPN